MFDSGDACVGRIADHRAELRHRDVRPDRFDDPLATARQSGAQEGHPIICLGRMQDESHRSVRMHASALEDGAAAQGRLFSELHFSSASLVVGRPVARLRTMPHLGHKPSCFRPLCGPYSGGARCRLRLPRTLPREEVTDSRRALSALRRPGNYARAGPQPNHAFLPNVTVGNNAFMAPSCLEIYL